jgi:hypothetical protein
MPRMLMVFTAAHDRFQRLRRKFSGNSGKFDGRQKPKTPLVGELPRSNGQTTAWPAAPSRARKAER